MPLCFAYGSNMDVAAMRERCPASQPLSIARLPRHRLVLMREGYASVMRDSRSHVWGLLWNIALSDMRALDRYEDIASGLYAKVTQSVLTEGRARRALLYVGRNAGPGASRPGYLEGVLAAARELRLPDIHLHAIEALASKGQGRVSGADQPAQGRAGVRPTRASPLEPRRNPNAGWAWTP